MYTYIQRKEFSGPFRYLRVRNVPLDRHMLFLPFIRMLYLKGHICFCLMLAYNAQNANNFSPHLYNLVLLFSFLCHMFILVNERSRLHCGATSLFSLSSLGFGQQPLAMLCWLKLCTQLQILQIRYTFELVSHALLNIHVFDLLL